MTKTVNYDELNHELNLNKMGITSAELHGFI